jgi:DNA polymerase-3 subunit chi
MTRIDFYFNADPKLQIVCQLAAKAVQQGKQVLIYLADDALARNVDQLLWTFQPLGFVPHCMATDRLAAETPVVIGRETEGAGHDDILLNLHPESPPAFSRYQRLIEVVGADDDDRRHARERFRFYRDRGYEIVNHDLAKASQ